MSVDSETPPAKRPRTSNAWLRSWAWKREHRPDKVRFDRPYLHPFGEERLTIHQSRFKQEGFASTVWDSSIVLAKYFERHATRFSGKRCLDLSAGCGLPGIVLSRLGAEVTATDLAPNLPLLERNAEANGCQMSVREHSWGEDVQALHPPFDIVCACDVMYLEEAVQPLLASLLSLSGPGTQVFIAHGRNRQAEAAFLAAAQQHFEPAAVPAADLDEVYQCADVDVLCLSLKRGAGSSTTSTADQQSAAVEVPSADASSPG